MTSIGVTSLANQRGLPPGHPSRHPSDKDLCDLVDIVVDTKMPLGDAVLSIDGVHEMAGPVSTILNAYAVNSIMLSGDRGARVSAASSRRSGRARTARVETRPTSTSTHATATGSRNF